MIADRDLLLPPRQQYDGTWRAPSGFTHEATPLFGEADHGLGRIAVFDAWGAWVRDARSGKIVRDTAPEILDAPSNVVDLPRPWHDVEPDNTGAIPW